ncbi:VgrG-related protein [uncultured Friedmanniella sp.]|uniref:VgrG-related protein n=1 Tax=uncultured Friedmanniella sp. TaxID=335381 RepID=UPI0035CA70BE
MSISATCLVEIDGTALPVDLVPLLTTAFVDDSQQLPDMFALRFRDPARLVLSKTSAKVGSLVKLSVQTAETGPPELLISGEVTALEAEYDTAGTFTVIRGYDQTHRFFRGRRTASYQQMTASDIASAIAQRAGLKVGAVTATTTVFPHLGQAGQTDWEVLSRLARDNNLEVTVREGSFSLSPPAAASGAPAPGGPATSDPLVLRLGQDLLRFRSVVTSAQQVSSVEVRGWDVATKQALTATESAATERISLPTVTPQDLASAFGSPVHVATDVPYRTQAEVDTAAKALADEVASAFAAFEGVARGNPQLRAGAPVSVDGLGIPFDGKYTITTSRHRFDPTTGYTTAFSVTGRQDRTLLGLTSGGPAATGGTRLSGQAGVVVGQVSDAADPEQAGRVRLTFPWLSPDYVSDWARTVQAGAGKDRGLQILPEVGDEVLVAFEQGDVNFPTVLGGLYNGVDTMPVGPVEVVDGGNGQINRRSFVSREGHRLDLVDSGGHEGVQVVTGDDQLKLVMDAKGTTITVHADGKVLIEGSQGVTIDSAGSAMELKGSKISLLATQGVSVDGGGGAVDVKSGSQLTLTGVSAKLEGSGTTEVKGGALCSVSAALVKIN